jgi:uncharacterized protein (DUF2342 family)
MMVEKPKPARELAARALCRLNKQREEDLHEGKPMWESYLGAADVVLEAIGWKEPDYIPVYRMREVPEKR